MIKISELLTANYDPQKDRITGCKRGSLAWLHERGHQEAYRSGRVQALAYWGFQSLLAAIFLLCVGEPSIALIFFCGSMSATLYEEIDAWYYALKKRRWI